MQKAYSYIRFSRKHQEEGDSYRRQKAETDAYCRAKGLVLDDSLKLFDKGKSAYTGANVQTGYLGKFLTLAEQGQIPRGSALIVESLDRLSRQSPRKTIAILTQLLDAGIELHLTRVNRVIKPDSSDEGMDLIMAVAEAMRSHNESEVKSDRLRKAWEQKRIRAKNHELLHPSVPWWLEIKDGKITAPEERAKIVKEVFELTAKGYSSAKIARLFNSRKVPTWRPKTKQWLACRVRGLVNSEAPLGHLTETMKTRQAGRTHRIENYYPALITAELAIQARATLKKNIRGARGRDSEEGRPVNLLRGLLRHKGHWIRYGAHRNGTYDPTTKKKRLQYYYECLNEGTDSKLLFVCNATYVDRLLLAALKELKPLDLAPVTIRILMAPEVQRNLDALRTKANNLLLAIESGSTAVAQRLAEIEGEIKAKEKELQEAQIADATVTTAIPEEVTLDLTDNKERERIASALRTIIEGVEAVEDLRDLEKGVYAKIIRGMTENTTFDDPLAKYPRAKSLALLVTFTSGARRLIHRVKWKEQWICYSYRT